MGSCLRRNDRLKRAGGLPCGLLSPMKILRGRGGEYREGRRSDDR